MFLSEVLICFIQSCLTHAQVEEGKKKLRALREDRDSQVKPVQVAKEKCAQELEVLKVRREQLLKELADVDSEITGFEAQKEALESTVSELCSKFQAEVNKWDQELDVRKLIIMNEISAEQVNLNLNLLSDNDNKVINDNETDNEILWLVIEQGAASFIKQAEGGEHLIELLKGLEDVLKAESVKVVSQGQSGLEGKKRELMRSAIKYFDGYLETEVKCVQYLQDRSVVMCLWSYILEYSSAQFTSNSLRSIDLA